MGAYSSGIHGVWYGDQNGWGMFPGFDGGVNSIRLGHAIETHCKGAEVKRIDGEHMQ